MNKKILLYCPNITSMICDNLKTIKLFYQTQICHRIKEIVENMNDEICLLLVTPEQKLDCKTLEKYLPTENIPQIFNLADIPAIKERCSARINIDGTNLSKIDNFLDMINIPQSKQMRKVLKYAIYLMDCFGINNFSYKLLKLVSCLLGQDYNDVVSEFRYCLNNILKYKNSSFLYRTLQNTDNHKIYFLSAIDYSFEKYIHNKELPITHLPYYDLQYFIERSERERNKLAF